MAHRSGGPNAAPSKLRWSLQCWCVAFLVLLCLDGVWLSFAVPRWYAPAFRAITHQPKNAFRVGYGFIAWALLAGAVVHCCWPCMAKSATYGALAGLVIYGVYNSTMLSTFTRYPVSVALTDTCWGIIALTVASSLTSFFMYRKERLRTQRT